jgi:delta14-sterol reductase
MDITTDGFGFMLSVGDLTWVPFTYSLQLVYLSFVPLHLSNFQLALVLAVQLVGYAIFRISNEEKNAFRRKSENPKGEFITTSVFFFFFITDYIPPC